MLPKLPSGAWIVLTLATIGASAEAGQALCKGSGEGPAPPALGGRLREARGLEAPINASRARRGASVNEDTRTSSGFVRD